MRAINIVSGLGGLVGGIVLLNVTAPAMAALVPTVGGLAAFSAGAFFVLGIVGEVFGMNNLLDGLFPEKRAAKAKAKSGQ